MSRKNYHPFVSREAFKVESGTSKAIHTYTAGLGSRWKGSYIHVQDMHIWLPAKKYVTSGSTVYNFPNLLMRFGYVGRGYFLEEPLPIGTFCNGIKPSEPCWNFIKPYTIYPGQKMSAHVGPNTRTSDPKQYPSILFNGVRLTDGKPIMLYDVAETAKYVGDPLVPMYRSTMQCPSDSPVNIYSVAIGRYYYGEIANTDYPVWVEVFDPDNRPWLQVRSDSTAETLMTNRGLHGAWIDPVSNLIELGPDRGWILPVSQPLILEYENRDTVDYVVCTTIRGFVEVEA